MFRRLLKTGTISVDREQYDVRYFELHTRRGTPRFSAEIVIDRDDRIILDDDSVVTLEARAARVVPAMIYSRRLAGTA